MIGKGLFDGFARSDETSPQRAVLYGAANCGRSAQESAASGIAFGFQPLNPPVGICGCPRPENAASAIRMPDRVGKDAATRGLCNCCICRCREIRCMGGGLLDCHGQYAFDGGRFGAWQLLDSGKAA